MIFPVNILDGITFAAKYLGMDIGETASESPHKSMQGTSKDLRAEYHRVSNLALKDLQF